MAVWKPHSLKLHGDAAGGAVICPDILNLQGSHNPEFTADLVAHNGRPLFAGIKSIKPVYGGETFALPTILDVIGVFGLGFTGATNPGMVVYFQKFDDNGDAAPGSVHRSLAIHTGVIVPKRLSVDHQGDAKLQWEIIPIKTTANAVVLAADNVALPTITAASARWTLGAMKVNNVALANYTGLEIDFGNTVEVRGSESDPYAAHVEVRTHEPTVKITGIDPTWFAASPVPLGGVSLLTANDYVYLRKRSQDGSHFVANGTSEHIKFALAGVGGVDSAIQGQAQRIGETTLNLKLAVDASGNNPLIASTATTHP